MPTPEPTLPRALLRSHPSDFIVEELPAYSPSGEGPHLFVSFRKTGLNSGQAARRIAAALAVDPREIGLPGNKDRHAVTTQTASFLLPHNHDGALPEQPLDGIELLSAARHGNKLRTGHLRGNRFTLTLRGIDAGAFEGIEQRLRAIAADGVPNAFGPQRFGRNGDNVQRARDWVIGGGRPPRDRKLRRLLFSSLQSELFNQLLAQRVEEGSWATVLAGDLAQKRDSGGVFWVEQEALEVDRARAQAGEICATGPMFGSRMRWPKLAPGEAERALFEGSGLTQERLKALAKMGSGARRPLRLWVGELSWQAQPAEGVLQVCFSLAKGGYATTVLSGVCQLVDVTRNG